MASVAATLVERLTVPTESLSKNYTTSFTPTLDIEVLSILL